MKGKYLITTDAYFIAPDGVQYRAVWGDVQVISADEALGIQTNRNSSNWFIKIGTEGSHVILAGCQVHYATACPKPPNFGRAQEWSTEAGKLSEYSAPTKIWNAESSYDHAAEQWILIQGNSEHGGEIDEKLRACLKYLIFEGDDAYIKSNILGDITNIKNFHVDDNFLNVEKYDGKKIPIPIKQH